MTNEPDKEPCHECGGTGGIDSGGFTPWGAPIDIPCPSCELARARELQAIGAAWRKDSSLEKWFPFTAKELATLKAERDALMDALRGLVENPVISGMSAHIRDEARKRKVANPYEQARTALEQTNQPN